MRTDSMLGRAEMIYTAERDDIPFCERMIIKPIRIWELAHQGEWRRLLRGGSAKAERRCEAPSVPKADLHRKEYIPLIADDIHGIAVMIYRSANG